MRLKGLSQRMKGSWDGLYGTLQEFEDSFRNIEDKRVHSNQSKAAKLNLKVNVFKTKKGHFMTNGLTMSTAKKLRWLQLHTKSPFSMLVSQPSVLQSPDKQTHTHTHCMYTNSMQKHLFEWELSVNKDISFIMTVTKYRSFSGNSDVADATNTVPLYFLVFTLSFLSTSGQHKWNPRINQPNFSWWEESWLQR